jgi:hypothetical protein
MIDLCFSPLKVGQRQLIYRGSLRKRMEAIIEGLEWVRAHPRAAVGIVAVITMLWGLAQRKPRVFREADREFERLRNNRGPSYDKTRPL